MTNFIATVLLLAISAFVINLFPAGNKLLANLMDTLSEKTTLVTQEYERVKGRVDEVITQVEETKEQVDKTVEAVNNAATSASKALDQVNDLLEGPEKESSDATKSDSTPK